MNPGVTDLTAVALPELPALPAGHRWVIERSNGRIFIYLEEQKKNWWGSLRWRNLDARRLIPTWKSGDWVGGGVTETLVECAERVSQEIYESQVKRLERLLEEESIIGVYESNQNKALPN